MSVKSVFMQIGRTAALCGSLGLLLYLFISYASHYSLFPSWLAVIFAAALMLMIFMDVRFALTHGYIAAKIKSIRRDEEPLTYWSFLALEVACGCAAIAVALIAILRIAGGTDNGLLSD